MRRASTGKHSSRLDAAVGVVVLGYSAVLNRLLPRAVHVPANLLAAGTFVAAAHGRGASWEELGFAPSRLGHGARTALVVAVPIALGTAALAVTPSTRHRFHDPRVRDAQHPAFEIGLRIPIGTALCEELIFRSALLAYFEQRGSPLRALVLSSALFGLWHVLPTLDAGGAPAELLSPREASIAVVGNVAVTAAAGAALTLLRRRSGSLVAPVLVHTSINAAAFIAARMHTR